MAGMLPFPDRGSAGRLLGKDLKDLKDFSSERQWFLVALPRGGVPVAHEISVLLDVPLDVIVTRKIGYPPQPELGVGAIAESFTGLGGAEPVYPEPVYDERLLGRLELTPDDLADVVAAERAELARRIRVYRAGRPPPQVAGRCVIVVDDGLATGVTARAALRSLRAGGAALLVLAVPVAPREALESMRGEADQMVVLATPRRFSSVGEWYASFAQLTDTDVLALLR
jgi:putative phosphoribosyl transferase